MKHLALLLALAALLYGGHLADGYLSDDFLYLTWADDGLEQLLRKVTLDSDPRMIRPLPALCWTLAALPGGAVLLHGLSLVLHALAGWLVARLASRAAGARAGGRADAAARQLGLLLAVLFVSFPLFTEPVIWLSASPDLWAAVFALAALDVGLAGSASWRRLVGAAGLFALSLLSKESTLMLPLVALCFAPWRRSRRLAVVLGAVAFAYLGARLLLFQGPGGYLAADGRPLVFDLQPLRFLRNLVLQLPYRLLVPLKRAGELTPALALVSAALGLLVITTGAPWRRPRALALALAAAVLALLPAAPLFSVDVDHENSRMLYFPVAIGLAAAGAALARSSPGLRPALVAVAVFWSLCTVVNGRPWSEGAREIRSTLATLRQMEPELPADATVLVAGHDTWRGAYVWRNGYAFAFRRAGLRQDVEHILGTAALIGRPQLLGLSVFEVGPAAGGRIHDWTMCQSTLQTTQPPLLAIRSLAGASPDPRFPRRFEAGTVAFSEGASALAVALVARADRGDQPLAGRLYWRLNGGARFNVTDSRRFRILPAGRSRSVVRLPVTRVPVAEIALRIELEDPDALGLLTEVRVVEAPEICLR